MGDPITPFYVQENTSRGQTNMVGLGVDLGQILILYQNLSLGLTQPQNQLVK